jgi:hypothetical protein
VVAVQERYIMFFVLVFFFLCRFSEIAPGSQLMIHLGKLVENLLVGEDFDQEIADDIVSRPHVDVLPPSLR